MSLAKLSAILRGAFGHVTAKKNPLTGRIRNSAGDAFPSAEKSASRRVLLAGDSITAQVFDTAPSVTAIVDNGDGTATVTFSGSHNFAVGHPIVVNNAPDRKFNTFASVVSAIVNTNPYTATYALPSRTSPLVGAAAANTIVSYGHRKSCLGWAGWLEFVAKSKIDFVLAAAGGADSTQVAEMIRDARTAGESVDEIMLCVGMNDAYARGWSYATTKSGIQSAIAEAFKLGAPITIYSIPPRDSSKPGWSAGAQTVHNKINMWLADYCAQIGVDFVDTWVAKHNGATWVNAAAANPDPLAGFTNATDGTHPLNVGAYAYAAASPSGVLARLPKSIKYAHSAIATAINKLVNPRLTGVAGTKTPAGGTINGTVPDSWTVEITAGTPTITLTSPARTVAADGDADGNNLQAVFAYSGAGTQTFRLNQSSLQAAVTVGDVMDIEIPVTISGATGMTGMELILFGTKSAGGNENIGHLVGTSSAMAGDFDGSLRLDGWTVPSGLTSLIVFARFYFTSGGATILFGKPRFEPRI